MENKYKILFAEDERGLRDIVTLFLRKNGFEVDTATNGNEAYSKVENNTYDAVVLDIMMPGMSGLEVLSKMREKGIKTPVLMLTAKAQIEDKVLGLETGADDYLTKPFATSELIARVKALGRRSEVYTDSKKNVGNLVLDGNRYEMRVGDKAVNLTNKEFQLMELFVQHPGFVFSTEHLI